MPTGTTDFNQPLATDPTSPGQGIAQTGNRLLMGGGSNSASGRWIWATGFEDGLADSTFITLGAISNANVYQGANALKFTLAGVSNGQWTKSLFAQGKKYGLECMISFQNAGAANTLGATMRIAGPHKINGQRANLDVQILTSNPGGVLKINGVTFATVNDQLSIGGLGYYHYFKVVFDPYENAIARIYFDDLVFDIGGTPSSASVAAGKYLEFSIFPSNSAAGTQYVGIDNIVITADEP